MDEKKVMIMTDQSPPNTIFNTISMLCPGLVMLYNSLAGNNTQQQEENNNKTKRSGGGKCPVTGMHTLAIHMQKSLFTTTSDR